MPSYVRGRENGRTLDNQQIVDLYLSGETAESIAQRAQCCGATVLQIVRQAGHPVRKPGKAPTKPLLISDSDLVRRYRAGEPGTLIAIAAGCTPSTVYRALRNLGVEIRPAPSVSNARMKARGRE